MWPASVHIVVMLCLLFPPPPLPNFFLPNMFYLPLTESPWAHLQVVGDVAVYVFDVNQPSLPTPFYSVFSQIPPTTLRFLTLLFRSYFCLIGPFSYISLYESVPQP